MTREGRLGPVVGCPWSLDSRVVPVGVATLPFLLRWVTSREQSVNVTPVSGSIEPNGYR